MENFMKSIESKPAGRKTSGAEVSAELAIEEYIANAPGPARKLLEEIRAIVRATAPVETTEVFSYGIPGFKYKGTLLSYGAFKQHCGFFPGSPPMLKSLAPELTQYKTTRGGVQFPLGKPLPAALVKKIVKLRVAENETGGRY
jgi:uncharacterized protein YdhG (YjbR/CyaY superfamily)